ncbi:MAG: 50S ribosomal protein L33 [Candidatus Nomurabacteria bacterium]|nr:50S ribosomal protein L33 [Candidatus Nomurabacteria bacterium]
MAKSNSKSKRKLIGLISNGHRLYTTVNPQNRTLKNQGKLKLRKYNPKTRQHEVFTEFKGNLGRNVVKARKS